MYEIISRMYVRGKLSVEGVQNAVKNGWITEDQAEEIVNGKREA